MRTENLESNEDQLVNQKLPNFYLKPEEKESKNNIEETNSISISSAKR